MFLSRLAVATSDDPALLNPGREWLSNLYRVHQRLCMAFPSKEQVAEDPNFIRHFKPSNFLNGHIHVERTESSGFLFRIEKTSKASVIIVQSAIEPNWDYAFCNASYLLAKPAETKIYAPNVFDDGKYAFRLLVNATKKTKVEGKKNGRRIPVPLEELSAWLARVGNNNGFSFDEKYLVIQPSYAYINKGKKSDGRKIKTCQFDGILTVNNSKLFDKALFKGIGASKAFGFGLLSIAPYK